MICDCSVHRSAGFSPSPHLGSKLLCKKGLLEELGWERTSELVALGSVLGKLLLDRGGSPLGGQAGTSYHGAHQSH